MNNMNKKTFKLNYHMINSTLVFQNMEKFRLLWFVSLAWNVHTQCHTQQQTYHAPVDGPYGESEEIVPQVPVTRTWRVEERINQVFRELNNRLLLFFMPKLE